MPRDRNAADQDEASKKPHIPIRSQGEILGVCTEILGGEHMVIKAENRLEYLGTIRGKIKKRMWVRQGDLVVIVPWDFESKPKEGKRPHAYIVWRYTRTQQSWLEGHGYIKPEFQTDLHNI